VLIESKAGRPLVKYSELRLIFINKESEESGWEAALLGAGRGVVVCHFGFLCAEMYKCIEEFDVREKVTLRVIHTILLNYIVDGVGPHRGASLGSTVPI
jgi:hypothetical protein